MHILIRHPKQRGYIFKVHKLQQQITAIFDLSVSTEEHNDPQLVLILDGAPIYTESISDSSLLDQKKILAVISKYREPLKKIAGMNSQTSSDVADEKYPEHHRWMNSVCSGE